MPSNGSATRGTTGSYSVSPDPPPSSVSTFWPCFWSGLLRLRISQPARRSRAPFGWTSPLLRPHQPGLALYSLFCEQITSENRPVLLPWATRGVFLAQLEAVEVWRSSGHRGVLCRGFDWEFLDFVCLRFASSSFLLLFWRLRWCVGLVDVPLSWLSVCLRLRRRALRLCYLGWSKSGAVSVACVCVCVEILEVEAASELDNSWFLLLCLLCVYPLPLLTRTQVFENGWKIRP